MVIKTYTALPAQKTKSPLESLYRSLQAIKMGLQISFISRANTGRLVVAALRVVWGGICVLGSVRKSAVID